MQLKDNPLLFIHGRINLKSIQDEKDFHSCMTDTFVSVHKGMILDKRKTKSRDFFHNSGVKFLAAKRHARLRQR